MATRSYLSLYSDVSAAISGLTIGTAVLVVDKDLASIAKNDMPPRVVFVPISSAYAPPQSPGQSPSKEVSSAVARPLLSKKQRVEVHCLGFDEDMCETLEAIVVTAVRQSMRRNVVFSDSTWQTPGYETNAYLLTVRFDMLTQVMEENLASPVTDAAPTPATVTSVAFDQTGASLTDGILQAGEG